jgi:hypothetical protein
VPIYTSYVTFASDVASGKLPPGSTVIYDNEPWALTPAMERKHPVEYEQMAAQLAAANDITIIDTPFAKSPLNTIEDDVGAARYGSVVEIQAQFLDRDPDAYSGFVKTAVDAIRAVNPSIPILAGLATDSGGTPTSAQDMYQEYKSVKSDVQGFWLNAKMECTGQRVCLRRLPRDRATVPPDAWRAVAQ